MTKYCIFDLDNCLVDDRDRIPLIDWTAPNPTLKYHEYHAACQGDAPGNLETYRYVTSTHKPIFLTARPESVRSDTRTWISRWLGVTDPMLMMRQNFDHRPSVELKRDLLKAIPSVFSIEIADITAAYDDREDIVAMYREQGLKAEVLNIHDVCAYTQPAAVVKATEPELEDLAALGATRGVAVTAADVLGEMADTYRERNKTYGDNFRRVGHVMQALHPEGVQQSTALDHELFHLWSLLIVKASRFAVSGLTHEDSIKDLGVYAAMIDGILLERNNTKETK